MSLCSSQLGFIGRPLLAIHHRSPWIHPYTNPAHSASAFTWWVRSTFSTKMVLPTVEVLPKTGNRCCFFARLEVTKQPNSWKWKQKCRQGHYSVDIIWSIILDLRLTSFRFWFWLTTKNGKTPDCQGWWYGLVHSCISILNMVQQVPLKLRQFTPKDVYLSVDLSI